MQHGEAVQMTAVDGRVAGPSEEIYRTQAGSPFKMPPEVWLAHLRYAETGDEDQLAWLVEEYDGYARSLARKMHRGGESVEDLEQVAREALVGALQRYEPDRGIPFYGFAQPTILGALRRYFRDSGWAIRIPRSAHEILVAVGPVTERLTEELGRLPTDEELAEGIGVDVEQLTKAQVAARARAVDHLDATPTDQDSRALVDLTAAPAERVDIHDRLALGEALAELDDDDRELLELYYVNERTQTEIAEVIGVSQVQVSRLLSNIVRRLRTVVHAD